MQIGVAGGGKEVRIGLVVGLDFSALDVGQGIGEAARPGGDGALLVEARGGNEQALVEQVEFHAAFFQQGVLA